MSRSRTRRLAAAVAIAAAALVPTATAQADTAGTPADCGIRLERLEAQFHEMADRLGYEAASAWWAPRWRAYHESCVLR